MPNKDGSPTRVEVFLRINDQLPRAAQPYAPPTTKQELSEPPTRMEIQEILLSPARGATASERNSARRAAVASYLNGNWPSQTDMHEKVLADLVSYPEWEPPPTELPGA